MSDALARARPFLFDRSFDDEARRRAARKKAAVEAQAAAEEEEAPPPPPTYSEEELAAAKEQAWRDGHAAGVEEAKQQQNAATDALLESIAAQVSGLHVHQDIANERLAAEVAGLGADIVRKILPAYAERHGVDEIKAVLGECLQRLTLESRISVSVAESARDSIEPHLEALVARSGFEGRVMLVADPDLGPAEVIVTWDNGGVDRRDAALWERLDEILARARDKAPEQPAAAEPTAQPPENEPPPAGESLHAEAVADGADAAEPAPGDEADGTAATEGDSGHSTLGRVSAGADPEESENAGRGGDRGRSDDGN